MGALEKTGTKFPNGISIDKGELFIDGVAVRTSAAELNSNVGIGTTAFQAFSKAGTAANGAIVFTSLNTIAGFNVNGFTSAGAPIAVGTAVVSSKTLTVTPASGGVATDVWYVQTWA